MKVDVLDEAVLVEFFQIDIAIGVEDLGAVLEVEGKGNRDGGIPVGLSREIDWAKDKEVVEGVGSDAGGGEDGELAEGASAFLVGEVQADLVG